MVLGGLLTSALGLISGPAISAGFNFLKSAASSLLGQLGRETFVKGFQAVHKLGSDTIGDTASGILKYVTGKRFPNNYDANKSYSVDPNDPNKSELVVSEGRLKQKLASFYEGLKDVSNFVRGKRKANGSSELEQFRLKPSRKKAREFQIII